VEVLKTKLPKKRKKRGETIKGGKRLASAFLGIGKKRGLFDRKRKELGGGPPCQKEAKEKWKEKIRLPGKKGGFNPDNRKKRRELKGSLRGRR